jgi:hypothetical protein
MILNIIIHKFRNMAKIKCSCYEQDAVFMYPMSRKMNSEHYFHVCEYWIDISVTGAVKTCAQYSH